MASNVEVLQCNTSMTSQVCWRINSIKSHKTDFNTSLEYNSLLLTLNLSCLFENGGTVRARVVCTRTVAKGFLCEFVSKSGWNSRLNFASRGLKLQKFGKRSRRLQCRANYDTELWPHVERGSWFRCTTYTSSRNCWNVFAYVNF